MIYVRKLSVNLHEIVSQRYDFDRVFLTQKAAWLSGLIRFADKKAHRSELLIRRCAASVGSVIGILCAIEVTLRFRDV
jgi:hypothetical protein